MKLKGGGDLVDEIFMNINIHVWLCYIREEEYGNVTLLLLLCMCKVMQAKYDAC